MGVVTQLLSSLSGHILELTNFDLQQEAHSLLTEFYSIIAILQGSRIAFYLFVITSAYFAYKLLFSNLRHIRRVHEVGYLTEETQSAVDRANEVRKRRRTGDLPPVYPNGWYRICEASQLRPGEVRQAHILGKELAVFRTHKGSVGVIDAYCPHLGANIAAGGVVVGEHIQCPFHAWEFDHEGTCKKIPYSADKIPEQAHLKKYETVEVNDQILIWFDAEGRLPTWFPPEIPEIGTKWTYRGFSEHHINAHIQEVPENAADVAHLHFLHGPSFVAGTDLRKTHEKFQFFKHVWEARWEPNKEDDQKHLSVLYLKHMMTLFGIRLRPFDLDIVATQVGPGLVYLKWKSLFGNGIYVQSLTPQEPLKQRLVHCIYATSVIPTFIAKIYLIGEAKQVERDVMVWNNKMYRKKPVLVKEDQLIAHHRRWYKQFYSENSPQFEFVKENGFDW